MTYQTHDEPIAWPDGLPATRQWQSIWKVANRVQLSEMDNRIAYYILQITQEKTIGHRLFVTLSNG